MFEVLSSALWLSLPQTPASLLQPALPPLKSRTIFSDLFDELPSSPPQLPPGRNTATTTTCEDYCLEQQLRRPPPTLLSLLLICSSSNCFFFFFFALASFRSLKSAIFDREERKQHYQAHIRGLNAYDKHKKFLNDYVKYYGKERPADQKLPIKTDQDALREGYRFIRTEEDDMDRSWEQRLVKRYYDKLFKEYCIADMSKYKSGKVGLRWRTEKEVMSGKGQFICGNKHCDERDALASFEVNFSYVEAGENKQALVKLVACNRCAEKLHYRRNRERDREESQQREDNKRNSLVRKASISDEEVDDEDDVFEKSRTKSEYRDKKSSKRRRSSSAETTDEEIERSKEGKKKELIGKRALAPRADREEDENFDEFLEGMFP